MKFNFEESLNKGKSAADLVINNNNEIKAVLDEFNGALADFIGIEINFKEEIEYEEEPNPLASVVGRMFARPKPTGKTNVYIQNKSGTVKSYIFTLEKNKNGYPISIIFDKNCFVADTQAEVANAINEISANSQFHISLNSFIIKQKNEDDKKSNSSSQEA